MKRLLIILLTTFGISLSAVSQIIDELQNKIIEEIIYVDPEMENDHTDVTLYLMCGSGIPAYCSWYESDKKTYLTPPANMTYPASAEGSYAFDRITKYTVSIPRYFQDGLTYYASWTKYPTTSGKIEFWKKFVIRYAKEYQFNEIKNVHHMQVPIGDIIRIAPTDVRIENYFAKLSENSTSLVQADSICYIIKNKAGIDYTVGANYGKTDNTDYAAWMAYEFTSPKTVGITDTIECWAYKGSTPLCKIEKFYIEYRDDMIGTTSKPLLSDRTLRTLYKESFESYNIADNASYCADGLGKDSYSGNWICLAGLYDGTTTRTQYNNPSRGEYGIIKKGTVIYSNTHTVKDGNQSLFIDAGNVITKYYEKVITNMCAGVSLQFSAWAYSSNFNGSNKNAYANLKFVIRNADTDEEITSFTTGQIPKSVYHQYGTTMTVPDNVSNIKFEIWNNTLANTSNDMNIDDIEISLVEEELGTIINYSQDQVVSACSDLNQVTFSGMLENSPYNRTYYKWQVSTDKETWNDISAITKRPQFNIKPAQNSTSESIIEDGDTVAISGYYRLVAGDYRSVSQDLLQCVQVSKTSNVYIKDVTINLESKYGQQNVCNEGRNGSIEVKISGGNAPYNLTFTGHADTVLDNNNKDTFNVRYEDLDIGTYYLNIRDSNNCTTSEEYTILEDPAVEADFNLTSKPSIGNSDGSFTIGNVKKGNVLVDFSYEIRRYGIVVKASELNTAGSVVNVENLPTGVYEVEVYCTDLIKHGCSLIKDYLVSDNLDYEIRIDKQDTATSVIEGATASIALNLYSIQNGTATVCNNEMGQPIYVSLNIHDISAEYQNDYTVGDNIYYTANGLTENGITIPAKTYYTKIENQSNGVTIKFPFTSDWKFEPDETFRTTITSIMNDTCIQRTKNATIGIGSPFSSLLTIQDPLRNDTIYVMLNQTTGYGKERKNITYDETTDEYTAGTASPENGWFEVTLRDKLYQENNTGEALNVYYHVEIGSSKATLNEDYKLINSVKGSNGTVLNSAILTIPKNASSGKAYIQTLDDNIIEGDEFIIVKLDSIRTATKSYKDVLASLICIGRSYETMENMIAGLPETYRDADTVTIIDDEILTVKTPIEISIRPKQSKISEGDSDDTRDLGLYLINLQQTHLNPMPFKIKIEIGGDAKCGEISSTADEGDFTYSYIDTTGNTKNYTTFQDETRSDKANYFWAYAPANSTESPLFYIDVNNDKWLEYRQTEKLILYPSIGNNNTLSYPLKYTDPNTLTKKERDITVTCIDSAIIEITDDEWQYLIKTPYVKICSGDEVILNLDYIKGLIRKDIDNIDNYTISYVYNPHEEIQSVNYGASYCYSGCEGFYQRLSIESGDADVVFDGTITLRGNPYSKADHTQEANISHENISQVGPFKLEVIQATGSLTVNVKARPRIILGTNKLK